MKYVTIILFAILFGNLNAQENKCLKEINDQVWVNFTKSFETFNHKLFGSLHAENFVRASGNSKTLNEKKTYIKSYENRWKSSKNTQTISFRFLERFCDEKRASERGIYKFTTNPGKENEQSFYGKFHVVLVKKENNWNFLVDYDSDEGNTINKSSYEEAYGINDFSKY